MTSGVKLSICIATYNRGKFIGETLDQILGQMQPDVELVVVDGASSDNTAEVMAQYLPYHPEMRYYREQENSGVDRDYDKAVGYALGEYCWLMTDDDLLRPDAVRRVLTALNDSNDLVIVNVEVRNVDCSKILDECLMKLPSDRQYREADAESLFAEAGHCLSFIGCVVIKRDVWRSRDRASYYGTLFVHVGVIFQMPPMAKVAVMAEPLISIRYGNAMWTARGFEIWMFKWPELVWSFSGVSDHAKKLVCQREPWRSAKKLALSRAIGGYSILEYRRYLAGKGSGLSRTIALAVAATPASLVNAFSGLYILLLNRKALVSMYDVSRSRHSTWVSRLAAHMLGI